MITIAAIIWAVLATVGAVAIYWLQSAELRKFDDAGYECWIRALDAEEELEVIKTRRHLSAKHARAAQIAQRAAKVAATANELRREAAVKRLAA